MDILNSLNSAGNSGTFFYLFPLIAKVDIKSDGFSVYGKWVHTQEILNVYYSDTSKYFPLFPKSWTKVFKVLTRKELLTIHGQQQDLQNFLDKNLKVETEAEMTVPMVLIGYVKRWKQPGQLWGPASPDDLMLKISENLNKIKVDIKYLYLALAIVFLLILFFVFQNLLIPFLEVAHLS